MAEEGERLPGKVEEKEEEEGEEGQKEEDQKEETQQEEQEEGQELIQPPSPSPTPPQQDSPRAPSPPQDSPRRTKLSSMSDQTVPLGDRLSRTLTYLQDAHEDLKAVHMKEYDHLEELKESLECVRFLGDEFEREHLGLCRDMGAIRAVLEDIQATVTGKLSTEGLQSWLQGPPAHPADKKCVSEEKSTLAQAARARAAVGRAAAEVPRAEERAAKLELHVTKAVEDAQVAAQEAEEAARMAEEARKAAELKRQAEEEAARKAEIARKKKEEEERKKREEEARRREEETRLAGSPEELERRKKEAERRDPNNWTPWVYSVEPGDLEIPVGCVVRCISGGLRDRDALTVEKVEQLGGPLQLGDNEELVSNIIRVGLSDEEAEVNLEEPLAVAIPHCAPRVHFREHVVKVLQPNGKWSELPSADVSLEDMKEYKFTQVRVLGPATLAVVTRVRKETFNVFKKGAKVIPNVDSRICVTFKPTMYKNATQVVLEVQPVELAAVTDVKYRYRDDCELLLASSPMLSLKLPTRKLHKPVTVQMPVPPNPNKKQRPTTAAAERSEKPSSSKARPTSAFITYKKDDEEEDMIQLLQQNAEGVWSVVPNLELSQAKNKDLVVFTMENEVINRVMILRVKNDVTVPQVEKIANLLDHAIKHRITQVLCRQRNDDPATCVAQVLPLSKIERYQRKFDDEGYENGPSVSRDMIIKEGQEITLRFRGNIRPVDEDENDVPECRFVYNSHIRTRIDFTVLEIDTFAQKGIDCYRGFAQFFARGMVERESMEDKKRVVRLEEGDVLLAELLISLPKPPAEAPKPITRAPVVMKNDDLVSNDLLRHLAAEIGEEWKKLAQHLSIRRVRIQAILRNNVNGDTEESIYDMLLTWAKKVPRSANKVELLTGALMGCGRPDLAEDLKDKENDFRRARALSARDSNMRKAFIKVAQSGHVASDWRYLCCHLGLRDAECTEIEAQYSGCREQCYQGLLKWRQIKPTASVESLIRHLKKCKYHDVAAQVKHIIS